MRTKKYPLCFGEKVTRLKADSITFGFPTPAASATLNWCAGVGSGADAASPPTAPQS